MMYKINRVEGGCRAEIMFMLLCWDFIWIKARFDLVASAAGPLGKAKENDPKAG
jgi:hypothetical protein